MDGRLFRSKCHPNPESYSEILVTEYQTEEGVHILNSLIGITEYGVRKRLPHTRTPTCTTKLINQHEQHTHTHTHTPWGTKHACEVDLSLRIC